MKKLHIAGNLLKVLLFGALLTGCQNDDVLSPQETAGTVTEEQSGKVNAELKLVKDGANTLVYIKSGRFTGRLSKVYGQYYNTEYLYDDSTGELWITSKRYQKTTSALVQETKYKIVNGRCVTSIDVTNGWTSQYTINEMGRLNEINLSKGSLTQKKVFTYNYISATGTDRLAKIVTSTPVGEYQQINFTYTFGGNAEKVDKYPLNPEHTGLDMYLPYFGKFSDLLVKQVEVIPLPYTNQAKPYYRFFYGINSDGYATSREREYYPLGWGNAAGKESIYSGLQYSTNWQGI
jgi:hypothetical protein